MKPNPHNTNTTTWGRSLSWKRFRRSLSDALHGVAWLFRFEPNARIHLLFAFLVIILGAFFQITPTEWVAILLCIALVVALEMVNSALEQLANKVSTHYSPKIKAAKDLTAGAVLVVAIISAIIGTIIFLPHILSSLS